MFQLDSIIYVDQPDAREFCFFELPPSNPVGRADHPLGQEREPTLGLAEPGGVDWRIMDMGARSRREQVLDFRALVGVAEQYLVPYGDVGTLSIRRALPQSTSSRRGVRRDRKPQIGWGLASAPAVVPLALMSVVNGRSSSYPLPYCGDRPVLD